MAQRADVFDLAPLRLDAGEGRRIDGMEVVVDPFAFGGQSYRVDGQVPVALDLSRLISSSIGRWLISRGSWDAARRMPR